MKKSILIILISTFISGYANGQNLLEIYKKGTVKLTADRSYGAKNTWESLFNLYYDTLTKNVGREEDKKIVVAPNGSVFMSHKNRHEIWKFSPDGNFEKKTGSKGSKPGQFVKSPSIQPVVDNKYVFTSDVEGRLNFFDLDLNYFKSINMKYIPMGFQPTKDGEVLLKGFAIWKDKSRYMVVNLNINTGKEKVVYDYFIERGVQITTSNIDSIISARKSNPNFRVPGNIPPANWAGIVLFPDGRFIKTNRSNGDMLVFNSDGKELLKTKMDIELLKITKEDVLENYEMMKINYVKAIENSKEIIQPNSTTRRYNPDWSPKHVEEYIKTNQILLENLDVYKKIENYYPYFPYFSNIVTDDEGNLLVFEFTSRDEKQSNIFNVIAYDKNGQKLARTSFVCDDYELSFSESRFVISKGYAYALAKLKNTSGMPLRLVKFKISN